MAVVPTIVGLSLAPLFRVAGRDGELSVEVGVRGCWEEGTHCRVWVGCGMRDE